MGSIITKCAFFHFRYEHNLDNGYFLISGNNLIICQFEKYLNII